MAHQPDILLIILDTLRRDRLSAYGYPQATSPAFDAFAEQAVLFQRAISPAQWTIPAHASIFTGLYPTSHQVTQATSQLSPHIPTLAQVLQANGYITKGFSNNPLVGVLDNGLTRGFSQFYNYAGAAPNRPQNVANGRIQRATRQVWGRFARTMSQQFAQNDWLFRTSLHPLLTPIWTRSINYKGNTARSIDDLMGVIGQHRAGRDKPLFAFLNLMGGHMPYRPPRDYLHRLAPEISRDKAAFRFMGRFNADAARWASPTEPALSTWEREVIDGFYRAEVAHQDYHLGRLLAHLRQSGALDDTLVIIAADHGEGHGDHDFFGHSFVVYQELVHVPMAIHYPPRLKTAQTVTTNVSTRRLFHTVLDLAGITPTQDKAREELQALTLRPIIEGHADTEGDTAFAEAIPPHTLLSLLQRRQPDIVPRLGLTHTRRGVYSQAFKLATVADDVEGLFNITHDPAEAHDVSGQHAALTAQLQGKIREFVDSAHALRVDDGAVAGVTDDMLDNLRALGYIE